MLGSVEHEKQINTSEAQVSLPLFLVSISLLLYSVLTSAILYEKII